MEVARQVARIAARVAAIGMVAGALLASTLPAADSHAGPYAVIGGTVFRESGFSLAGATVTLAPQEPAAREGEPQPRKRKFRKLEAVSDARGEFAFRVPPEPGTYVVTASMKGFQPAAKDVSVSGEERMDVTLVLAQESK